MAYEQDYYKKLQEEDYKALLGSEQQLDAARRRALKNTQTQLDAMGMGSSGYGSTVRTGIESQYQQGLMNAQDQYRADVQYHQEQADQASAGEMQDYLTQLGIYQNDNDALYNRLMQDQYGSYGEDGKWVWNKEKLSTLNPKDAEMLKNGVTTLDYTNTVGNKDIIGQYVVSSFQSLEKNAETEEQFAGGILETLLASGVITEKPGTDANGNAITTRELNLDKLDKSTQLLVQQYVDRYDLLNPSVNPSNVYGNNNYFTQAYSLQNHNSVQYFNMISQGYNEILNGNYKVSGDAGKIKQGDTFKVTIDGQTCKVTTGQSAGSNISEQLKALYPSAGNGHIAYYNGQLYIYGTKRNEWYVIKDRNKNNKVSKLLEIIESYTKTSLGYDPLNPIS